MNRMHVAVLEGTIIAMKNIYEEIVKQTNDPQSRTIIRAETTIGDSTLNYHKIANFILNGNEYDADAEDEADAEAAEFYSHLFRNNDRKKLNEQLLYLISICCVIVEKLSRRLNFINPQNPFRGLPMETLIINFEAGDRRGYQEIINSTDERVSTHLGALVKEYIRCITDVVR